MGRIRIEANISKDEERNLYYACLYYGKSDDGKPKKSYVTASSLKEARRILREHNKQKQAGTAVPPVKDTYPIIPRTILIIRVPHWNRVQYMDIAISGKIILHHSLRKSGSRKLHLKIYRITLVIM